MLKTICYKSKVKSTLDIMDFETLFFETQTKNDSHNIKGVLVKQENTFFQIIEGESIILDALYLKIKNDFRHTNIIEILNTPISQLSFEGFDTGYVVIDHVDALYGLQTYIDSLKQNNVENSALFLEIIEDLLTTQ
ncbi:BLUF domain-containing protein [Psychroserpens sp. AS72]|uniref:BLUF domain-containing protein n=1 Tax=Psychroserpens sp. AS72 TaxID=3135775 RepID=UPI003173F8A8